MVIRRARTCSITPAAPSSTGLIRCSEAPFSRLAKIRRVEAITAPPYSSAMRSSGLKWPLLVPIRASFRPLRWRCQTPLGSPVEPEVYMM